MVRSQREESFPPVLQEGLGARDEFFSIWRGQKFPLYSQDEEHRTKMKRHPLRSEFGLTHMPSFLADWSPDRGTVDLHEKKA